MQYTAIHYVTVDGKFITRGEIFDSELDEAQEERLIRLGAIRKADAPAPDSEEPAQDAAMDAETGEAAQDAEAPETVEDAEETLEIDPMDAVIPAEAPKKKSRRKAQ